MAKSRSKSDEHNRSDTSGVTNSTTTRAYAAFPSPYQHPGQPGIPSTNTVLMHEPYQRRDQAEYYQEQVESSAPYSQRSPSPTSPTTSGQYFSDMTSYSGPSRIHSNSYADHPTSPLEASPYSPHYQPSPRHAIPLTATGTQNYSTPRTLSPPWVNHDLYHSARQGHNDPASSQSVPPMPYHQKNATPQGVNLAPVGHSSLSPRPNQSSFTPSYSLESAFTPLHYPGVSPAAFPIPPLQYTSTRRGQTPPDSSIMMEDQSEEDQSGLAPLNELKRQGRYRREPSDEKTLRLLIAAQSSP